MADETNTEAATAETTPATPDERAQHVQDLMSFDPFGPAEETATTADAGDTGTTEGDAGEGEGGDKTPAQTQAPTTTPTTPVPTQREQELTAQVQALQRAIAESRPQETQASPEKPQAKYNLGLPPQLIQGLRSEDEAEFAVAMHAVINGMANRIWNDVQEHLTQAVLPQVDQRVSAVVDQGSQVKTVHDEFYGAYPHLKNPILVPLIQRAALEVGRQWQTQGKQIAWNKDFADQVAQMVHSVVPQPQQQQQQAAPKPRQPFVAGTGSRPAPAKTSEFAELL